MKKFLLEFLRRGLAACGLGPVVLAVLYLILQERADLTVLPVNQVCIGIFSLTALAFLAGGMNVVYQMEWLPLMVAILIHGGVLYLGYLAAYFLNGWLEPDGIPVLVFTGIFAVGYLTIWGIIYMIMKRNADSLNKKLMQKRQAQI